MVSPSPFHQRKEAGNVSPASRGPRVKPDSSKIQRPLSVVPWSHTPKPRVMALFNAILTPPSSPEYEQHPVETEPIDHAPPPNDTILASQWYLNLLMYFPDPASDPDPQTNPDYSHSEYTPEHSSASSDSESLEGPPTPPTTDAEANPVSRYCSDNEETPDDNTSGSSWSESDEDRRSTDSNTVSETSTSDSDNETHFWIT